jgi:membrane protein implicated in regulation of membrane protease activity
MGIDIRLPIGLMFAIFGLLLAGYGLLTGGDTMYARHSLGININLWWGLVMLAFGVVMLLLGRRGTSAMHSSEESPEGRAIEELEHRTGREH